MLSESLQELVAYNLMESRNPKLCQKMELKVMDFLLKDVYTSKDYNLQRSRVLVTKGRAFRAHGTEGLSKCLECLSEAISLLVCSFFPSLLLHILLDCFVFA